MKQQPTNISHNLTEWAFLALVVLSIGIGGCPNSPLAELIQEQFASSNNDPVQDNIPTLPQPIVLSAGTSGNTARIEFAVDESDPNVNEILGFNAYRSEQSGTGYVIQRAFARFEERVFQDTSARPGITYYYVMTSVDRLGNESEHSEEVAIQIPLAANQIVVHADEITGTLCTNAMGVTDLNTDDMDFSSDEFKSQISDLGIQWWRVSMGRWDAGRVLDEQEIVEREVFFGTTLADAQNPALYRWTYLDRVMANALASGATPIISLDTMPRSLAQNTELLFRAPILSWSDNVRNSPPANNEVFAEVVKRIIMHYVEGWGDGQQLNLPYWELWHAPDVDQTFGSAASVYWTGTQQQFYDMYTTCHQTVKSHFGDTIHFGGAAFANPASIEPFLLALSAQNITPDFVSFIANNDLPTEIANVAQTVVDTLETLHIESVETFLVGFNMGLPLPGLSDPATFLLPNAKFDTSLHAIHYLAVFKSLCDLGISVALHDGLRDLAAGVTEELADALNTGLITRDHETKPASVTCQTLALLAEYGNRLQIEPASAVALASSNNDRNEITLILANTNAEEMIFPLDIRDMPWGPLDSFDWSLEVLNDDIFTATGDFGGRLGGTAIGKHLAIEPTLPGYSLLKLVVIGPESES